MCPSTCILEAWTFNIERASVLQVLFLQTDGGPDRNNTFANVQLSYVALALSLPQLKMLVVKRCAPGQSYVNPAERVMAPLNVALAGTALALADFDQETKKVLKNCNSMNAVRTAIKTADGRRKCAPEDTVAHRYLGAVTPCMQQVWYRAHLSNNGMYVCVGFTSVYVLPPAIPLPPNVLG